MDFQKGIRFEFICMKIKLMKIEKEIFAKNIFH